MKLLCIPHSVFRKTDRPRSGIERINRRTELLQQANFKSEVFSHPCAITDALRSQQTGRNSPMTQLSEKPLIPPAQEKLQHRALQMPAAECTHPLAKNAHDGLLELEFPGRRRRSAILQRAQKPLGHGPPTGLVVPHRRAIAGPASPQNDPIRILSHGIQF